jgi:hypothetical protein
MNREILPKLKRYSGHYWTILLDTELSLDGRNAFVMSYGTLDHWDSFNREDAFIFSEDGNVYQPEEVYKFVKVMDVQPEPERKNNSFSASFGLNASIVTQYYPWFELGSPSPMPEVENYSIVQAAAEVEAAYLHDHNDGHWGIKYAGVVTIEGEKAWKFIVYYMDDPDSHDDGNIKYSFKVAATTGHKLYRYQTDLKQLGKLPAGYQPPAKEDTEKEKNYKPSYAKDLGIGSLCYDESIDDGPYVSLALAAYWALDLVAKDMPGRKNYNAPWWAVPSKTKFDGVDAFEFEIGQGKRNKEDTRVKAIVTQDRKIYKILKDKPEFVGSIPEDALEP